MKFSADNIHPQRIDFNFLVSQLADEPWEACKQFQVSFITVPGGCSYIVSETVPGPKQTTVQDIKETGAVENIYTVCYAYAQRLLIELLNERY